MLDVEVGEDDGDVGYLPVPSAWTEERHGVLPTATLLRGTPGKREKLGREREVAARGRRGEVGLGFAAPWGSCSARGRWRGAPRRWWCAVRAAAFRRGNGDEGQGGTGRSEREERGEGAGLRARCAVEATGPARLAGLCPNKSSLHHSGSTQGVWVQTRSK